MRIERTKNAVRNTVFGFLYKIIGIILPFASRTVILYVLGEKYLGLSSLFTSILSFLSLAELGIGAAMVYSMYKPIAQNDKKTFCALLRMYRKLFNIVGCIILGSGLLLLPFLDKIINDTVPDGINLHLLYLLYLANTVLTYFLFAYKHSILQAHQRNDIDSKIGMVLVPISYVVMLSALLITKNYYAYAIWLPIFTVITNIVRLIYVNKHYPDLKPEGEVEPELKKSIRKKVAALIGTKLNTVVLHSSDNLVMSAYLGLTAIAMYGNYYYIMSSIMGFLGICYASMTAGLGNSIATETVEKNYNDFKKFSFINSWLVGWCTICLVCLYQPFMKIWVGDDLMFPFYMVILLAIYFYVYQIRKIPVVYKDAAGIWWEDRLRPYVCMIVNLVFNIVLVKFIGLAGIVISTIISLAISVPWENYTIFKSVFNRSSKEYYLKMGYSLVTTIIAGGVTYLICDVFDGGIWLLLVKGVICLILPNVLFILLNFKRQEFGESIVMLKRILKKQF